jgi:hypothetical protein
MCGFIDSIETDLASDDQPLIALVDKLRELKRLREGRLETDSRLHDLGSVP